MAANIRVFCETTKFLEEFLILALISHRFGFTSHWSVGPVDKSPFDPRFSIHGFAQILSLQQRFSLSFAAIDISLHANYAFFFGTRIARITRICCLVSKDSRDSRDSCSKINTQYYFLVAHGSHGSHGFFSLQATIRISPRLRLYYIISSYTYQFFEKCYICIVLQKISCTRQFESELSLHSLASLFPIKEGIFLPLRLSCKESSTS